VRGELSVLAIEDLGRSARAGHRKVENMDVVVVGAKPAGVFAARRASGVLVRESHGTIESFEAMQDGVRMNFSKDGVGDRAEAAIVVVAVGWLADG
jgi:hypothetical protein